MSIFDFLRWKAPKSASIAKERLQIVVSHQRSEGSAEFLPKLRGELLTVIGKYVKINKDQINVNLQKSGDCSILELNIMLPETQEQVEEALVD